VAVKVTRSIIDKQRGVKEVDIEDSHGRRHQIQVGFLAHPDPDGFIRAEIAKFAADEEKLNGHEEFKP
jgi:hypothetical protein